MEIFRRGRKLGFARKLRKRQTVQENILWTLLRNRGLHRLKFRRQEVIGPYIVDFLCMQYRLIVEIDGASHRDRKKYDAYRDDYLWALHYRILRFTNTQIERQLPRVLDVILETVQGFPTKHAPSPLSESSGIFCRTEERKMEEGEGVRG
ncbi:endonuclease domain-containing protein [Candidatus Peregrinibacteria bacterium]|nr:endonuclease domain-containing protein [Candidatus Peregrinibacteria bacterium]